MKGCFSLFLLVLQMAEHCETKQCYQKTCFKENCLQEAIDTNTVSTCQMDETYGCAYTKMVSSSVLIIAECPDSVCRPFHTAPLQETLCCNEDLCNNGRYIPDKSSTTHCHSFMCSSGWDCLQKGISDGYSRTCPMDTQYGCYVQKAQAGSSISVIAGCSERPCRMSFAQSGENRHDYTCCTGNICNDGNKRDANDDKGDKSGVVKPDNASTTHCHFFMCSSGWDCLQKGISDGYSRTCSMDKQYGCYVHKSQSGSVTSVRAGCSERPCMPLFAQSGRNRDEYMCCTGSLCNDGNKKDAIDDKGDTSGVCFVSPNFSATVIVVTMTY